MTTIKDKPLKKIICDTRVKIDSLHTDKLKEIKNKNDEINKINNKINKLEKEIIKLSDKDDIIKKRNEIIILKSELSKYDKDEYTDYYLENGLLLSDYYNNTGNNVQSSKTSKSRSILDFMKPTEENTQETDNKSYNDIIKQYIINTNDNVTNDFVVEDINMCEYCNEKLTMKHNNSEIYCDKCGYTKNIIVNIDSNSYKDPIRESTYFAYKRANHFNEWLAQFQAKETNDISEEIINNVIKELKKDKSYSINNINYNLIRSILKKLNYNKYYEHIFHIMYIITGKKSAVLDRNTEEQLRYMFKEIQQPFQKHCPSDRKNFLSYSYVLHKFCELLELKEFLICFPYLKSNDKLRQQDAIWKNICKELKWEYIPSI